MDPLSIAASTLTLTDAVAKVYRFLQSVHYADAGYAGLCTELNNLQNYSQSIDRALHNWQRHPMALAHIDEDVWKQSRNAISDSKQAIDDLDVLVKRIGGPVRSNSIFRRGKIAAELHFHTREIVAFRDKIRLSNLALQTLLQVINVSLSLRNDTSQTRILIELKQLKQHLENSTRASADDKALFEIDKSDAHVVRNLKSLVRAASDFHASASIQASTIFSSSQVHTNANEEYGSASSVVNPTITSSKRRQVEAFLRHARLPSRKNSHTPSGNIRLPPSPVLEHYQVYPEVVTDKEAGLSLENSLDSTLSGGFSKLVQKALRKFDFARAEKVLHQALDEQRISKPDDAHHSRLRTQLAICSFLQGKGSDIEDAVTDLAEFRGTKRSVAHQLLYNLALCLMHDLCFEAARKVCVRLWAYLSNPEFSTHVKKSDLFRLLVISYRESNKAIHAEALEEQHPELAHITDDGLSSILESVINCEELLVEFLGVGDISEVPRLFIHQLRDRVELGRKTPFNIRWAAQQGQRTADPGRPSSETNGQGDTKRHTSLRKSASIGVRVNHKAPYTKTLSRLKTVLRWQSTQNREGSDASAVALDYMVPQIGGTHTTIDTPRIYQTAKTYRERHNEVPLWQRLFPVHRKRMLRRREASVSPPNVSLTNPEAQGSSHIWPLNKNVSVTLSGSMTPEIKDMSVQTGENRLQSLSHDLGYKQPEHNVQNSDPENEQSPEGVIMTNWSSLRPSNQVTRKSGEHNRVQGREKTGPIRNMQAKLKAVVRETMSETNRVHQSGLVYEYLGPPAVSGPYTEKDGPPRCPHHSSGGVPMFPDNPENIRMPVELDSLQIKAVRYA